VFSQHIGLVRPWDAGQVKFSPDGNWFAYFSFGTLEILNFDRCTGQFFNHYVDSNLAHYNAHVGCEFSPFSDMLYVSNVDFVYQYTLNPPNIIASKQIVASYDGFYDPYSPILQTRICQPQLAPDGKIYITTGNSTRYFHTIHYPYFPGVACSLVQHDLVVPAFYYNTIPNHPNYFLGALAGSPCDTLTGFGLDMPAEIEIKVSPNPASETATCSFPVQDKGGRMDMIDPMGRVVFSEPVPPWSQLKRLDVRNHPRGLYLCRFQWPGRSATVRLLIE
jgi:hypothetical protein